MDGSGEYSSFDEEQSLAFDLKGEVVGRYVLTRRIGSGGMGDVYEGKHKVLDKRVAIKFLKPEFAQEEEVVKRFYNEAKIAASLSTENVVDVQDVGFFKDIPYIIMEFLDG